MHTGMERRKVHSSRDVPNAASRSGAAARGNIPNSAMLSMLGGDRPSGSSIDELGERIRSRLPTVQQRPQAQIPQAENEADRLSAAINAGTPESVKAMMGQRMGADFSGVRFHTGAAAAAKATAMGARAYTSGADVYFGEGGFDPSVAAHELVHTAQQGMVDSGVATMSTPVGGVQMWPWSKKKKKDETPKPEKKKKKKSRSIGKRRKPKIDLLTPIEPDEELEEISAAAARLGNWGGAPEIDDEELEKELELLMQEEDGGKAISMEELERELEEEDAPDAADGARASVEAYQDMLAEEDEINYWAKRSKKKLKQLEKRADLSIEEAERLLAEDDDFEEQLMNLKRMPDLYGYDAEAEYESLMQGGREETSEEDLDRMMAEMQQQVDEEWEDEQARKAQQAAPEPEKKKKKGFFSRIGSGIKNIGKKIGGGIKKAWDKTGGRLIRKHHDAQVELHEMIESGEWDQATEKEKKSWIRKNRLAYKRYMGSDKVKAETARRKEKRDQELAAANAFFDANEGKLGRSSMLSTQSPPGGAGSAGSAGTAGSAGSSLRIGHAKADPAQEPTESEDGLDRAGRYADIVDNFMIPPGIASAFQEAGWISQRGQNVLGGTLGGISIGTGAIGAFQAGRAIRQAFKDGNGMDKVDAFADMSGSLAKIGGGAGSVAKAFGKELGGKFAAGADIATGSVDMYKGGRQIHQGRMKHNAMERFQRDYFGPIERERLADHDMLLRDISTQGKMEGTRQKIKGAGKVVTGAVDAAAGVAELSGAGAAVGAGLKVANAAFKGGFAAANRFQKNRMEQKVVKQTTGLDDKKIKEFQKANGIKSFSRAKQALMKSRGYLSGTRAELYADQTEKRGQYLAELANSGTDDERVTELLTGLGVKQKDGQYDAGDVAESLGHWKDRASFTKKFQLRKKLRDRKNAAAGAGGTTP